MFGITVAVVTLLGSASPRAFRAPQVGARSIGGLLDTLDRVRAVRETAISPDGRRVAWVEDVSAGAQTSAIQVRTIGAAAGDVRRVTARPPVANVGSGAVLADPVRRIAAVPYRQLPGFAAEVGRS